MGIESNFDPSFCNKVNIAFDCGVLLAILSRILIIFSGILELGYLSHQGTCRICDIWENHMREDVGCRGQCHFID